MQCLIDLACEATVTAPYHLAIEAIDIIVHMEANGHHPAGRQVTECVAVTGFDAQNQQFIFQSLL